jgi:hypothetical protein
MQFEKFSKKFRCMYSAGILPYQVLENNQIFFLLGKGTDGTWSDFGINDNRITIIILIEM